MGALKISVIIPSYKPGPYLWQCLDSLQVQTLPKDAFEVILVLNGCKEPYESEIRKYLVSLGLNCKFIQLDEGGVSNARNVGIDVSKGEYIAFIDDDDYVSQSYLEELLKVSSRDTVGLCLPIAFNGKDNRELPYELTKEFDNKSVSGKQPFYCPRKLFAGPCMKLIHRDILGDRRFDKRFRNSEDSLYMFAVSNRMKWASFTSPSAIYYRRFREGSAVTSKRTFSQKMSNSLRIIWEETKMYFGHFPQYSFYFYATRVLGALRGAIED